MLNIFKKKGHIKTYKVENMHCASCAAMIETELDDIGVSASCSYVKQTLEIKDTGDLDEKRIKKAVKKAGYKIS